MLHRKATLDSGKRAFLRRAIGGLLLCWHELGIGGIQGLGRVGKEDLKLCWLLDWGQE